MLYRNCGRRIPDNSKFCVNCGIKIKDDISGYVRQRVIADSAKSSSVSDKIITYESNIIKK